MIEIRYKTDMIKEGRTFELTISGHANYAKKGKDIVCAGVSALTIALIRTLNDMKDNNEAEIEIDPAGQPGISLGRDFGVGVPQLP